MVTCGRGLARLRFFKQKFNSFRLFLPENDFQKGRKLISRNKRALLQLKEQNAANVSTFSRTEMSSLEVRRGRVTAFLRARRYHNVVGTILYMDFMVEILLLFLFYSAEFIADT